jgi:hypothetical protein
MAQLILTHSSQFHRALRVRGAMPLTLRVGKFFLLFGMTFMIGLLSFVHLVKFTEIHTKGYQLRKLEIQHDLLVNSKEAQSTDIAQLRALNSIRTSDVAARMVPMQKATFIKEDNAVASLPRMSP